MLRAALSLPFLLPILALIILDSHSGDFLRHPQLAMLPFCRRIRLLLLGQHEADIPFPSSKHSPQMSKAPGFAHAFCPHSGQVNFVLLDFFALPSPLAGTDCQWS